MSTDVAALERAVIDTARAWWALPDDERKGRQSFRLYHAVEKLEEALSAPAADEPPTWVARTMRDARTGDTIRLAGATGMQARVVHAELTPRRQHVKQGSRSWEYNGATYHDDKPLQHERCYLRLDYPNAQRAADGRPKLLDFPPEMAIEIRLTATELQAIEALGWENRLYVQTEWES